MKIARRQNYGLRAKQFLVLRKVELKLGSMCRLQIGL